MSGTKRWRIPQPPPASPGPRPPVTARPPEQREPAVEFSLRGQFRALDGESEPMHSTHITLWECSALDCAGVAIFGDRLEAHTAWHRSRRRAS